MDVNGKMKIRGAVFDLDGTLLNSLPVWETLPEDYLRSLGIEPKENLNEIFRDFSTEEAAAYYRRYCGVTLPKEEILSGIHRMLQRDYEERIPAMEGAAAFLACLKEQGIPMCVATLTDRDLALAALQRTGLAPFFREVLSDSGKGKGDPGIFLAAAKCLGTEPGETLVFEDSLYALHTAKTAGFWTCGVGPRTGEFPREADLWIAGFSDPAAFLCRVLR